MNPVQNTKSVVSLSAAAGVASAGTHTVAVDCLGYDSVSIDVAYRSIANTSAPSVVTLKHSDTDGSYATISGLVQGTDFTVGSVTNTAVVNITRFDVVTKSLKRYLQVAVTPAADATSNASNNTVVVACRLGKGEAGVDEAADAGVVTLVKGG